MDDIIIFSSSFSIVNILQKANMKILH